MNDTNLENCHYAAEISDLEDREPYPVDIAGEEIALVLMDDNIFAINNICTHEYACLSDGYIEDDRIVCPLHLAEFEVRTGAVVEDPAEEDLQTYPVVVSEGKVYVQV
ncbi:MAG: non-heme iron oxygenase ferredoxin subunit [Acidiferrobacterales bacterium]|nr:non-heme iron oxygenase ferredoxin subunit [Acidiferrobacterales bacterium]